VLKYLCFFILFFVSTAIKSTTFGTYYIPGLVIDDNSGLFIKLHREVETRLALKSELTIQPTKRIQMSFIKGLLDSYFPELVENLPSVDHVTSEPFWLKKIILVTPKNSPIKSIKDLQGKVVGAVSGYSYGSKIKQIPNVKLSYVNNDDANIERMMRGYIDAIIGDSKSTVTALENSQYKDEIQFDINAPIDILEVFYVCQATQSGKALCNSISNALYEMKQEQIINLNMLTGDAEIIFPNNEN